ncbi:esterase E4-like [Microplitis mediator]|uniref:esterase E4-like n=1 Tax=Microplitis mediator TaxID=375433 RepID=UPI002553DED1|nr:esterase E4-like [Microplitis mediator]
MRSMMAGIGNVIVLFLWGLTIFAAEAGNWGHYYVTESGPDNPEVTTPMGKIKGSIMTSRLGKDIYAFRGIRYGEPPVGQQRFKQAEPVKPWNGTLDATEEGPSCGWAKSKFQSEDCLRLNIYTTKLPEPGSAPRPVIVFFHPGGFWSLSGQSYVYGPEYYLDQDIVLVTCNYRIAALGFLSTGDSLAPGNLGFKDQVEVLRFVQKNIRSFNGDPDSVTISGQSAGAWSASLHLVSPMSKGLFHRAISQSGGSTYQNPFPPHQKDLAKKLASLLNCPTDATGSMLICLKTKSFEDIVGTLPKFFEWYGDPILVWTPVIEPDVPGVERFLTDQPVELIKQGRFHQVPYIAGIAKDEFAGVVIGPVEEAKKNNTSVFDDYNANWTRIAPISFLYERGTERSQQISEALRQFYFKGKPISLDNYRRLGELYADSVTIYGVHRLINLLGKHSTKPVYYYNFAYQGRYSLATWPDGKPYGVVHEDDLLYFFKKDGFPYFETSDPEFPTVRRMTSMWANFARTGEPIPAGNPDFTNVVWTPFTRENQLYLEIGNDLVMKQNLYSDRMNEWDRLFPIEY